MKRLRVGIIGTGTISGIYLANLTTTYADRVELLGCADLVPERAAKVTEEHKLPRTYGSVKELLADPDIDLVLNLTIPNAHFEVCLATVEAGKHTYVENPPCIGLDEAQKLTAAAEKRGVRVGGAPNTFGGPVLVQRTDQAEWFEIPLTHRHTEDSRGLGVAETASAIESGQPARTSSDLTHHVLEIMHGIHIASDTGKHYDVRTKGVQPEPLPTDF